MISYFCANIVNNSFEQISQQILFVSNHRGSSLEAKCFCSINSNRFSAQIFQHVPMTDSSTIFHMDCCFPGIRAANTPRAFHFRYLRHFLSSHLLSWGTMSQHLWCIHWNPKGVQQLLQCNRFRFRENNRTPRFVKNTWKRTGRNPVDTWWNQDAQKFSGQPLGEQRNICQSP